MTVCYTCGVEGKKHLIYCMHCQEVAIHSYCIDNPLKIRNKDSIWLCEDCDVEFGKPTQQLKRTSSRISSLVQKALQRKARKEGKNYKDIQDFIGQNCALAQESKDGRNQANLVKLMNDIDSSSPQCSIDLKSPSSTVSTENNLRSDFQYKNKSFQLDDAVNTVVEDEEYDEEYFEISKELSSVENDGNESFNCSYEEKKELLQHNESDDSTTKAYDLERTSNLVKRKYEDYFYENTHENDYEKLDNSENPRNTSYHEICDEQGLKDVRKKLILEKNYDRELNCLTPIPSNLVGVNSSVYSPPNVSGTSNFGATPLLRSISNVLAQPIIDVSWRGRCSMICNQHIPVGISAHLSDKAPLKVHGAISVLPQEINFKLVPKQEVWPKAFEDSPPTSADIALYFFPSEERDEEAYNIVLQKMINLHSAWTFNINNNLDLVLFSSQELPQEHWRFQRKYYMWGAFKPTQNSLVASSFTIRSKGLCGTSLSK